jgi:ferredoxin-type protein NapH
MNMMKIIKQTGYLLLLVSFGLFMSLFFMLEFKLTSEHINSIVQEKHQTGLSASLSDVIDQSYGNPIPLVSSLYSSVETLNESYRAEQKWDMVIYDPYVSQLSAAAASGFLIENNTAVFTSLLLLSLISALMFLIPDAKLNGSPGIKHNNIFKDPLNSRGWAGIVIGSILILFYVVIYYYEAYLIPWIIWVNPLKQWLVPGDSASQWFLYGFLYTFAVLVMGIRMLIKYRHSRYQQVRTFSVMFFQTSFAFLIPEILVRLNQPYFDFKNMWPLDYDFFDAWHVDMLTQSGGLGIFMFVWGITLFVIGVPLFTYLFGKRWYCSWVCGCGGLAETAGDPFRQLSDKRLKAWQIERWLIHGVLVFAIVMTAAVIYNFVSGTDQIFGFSTYSYLRQPYGFFVGAIFSGVVGTGFYPLMGNRVWCRFGCPLAAYLGFVQRFKSRFRITTNGGQCISCGNCSTYCEMGIDVRWYAQRGQNIVRSSCVGCGVCSSVCPRGVLNLENASEENRFDNPISISNEKVTIN